MNIVTRNTPRLYLRNGDLNLAEGGVAYYSSGIGSITGAYLPALPMEEGGYLVETPVTFMQNILMKRDLTVEGNALINGDLNINGSFTVNGKEFEAVGYLKDMKDVGYSANGENNKDTASDNDILVYNSTYQSWLYTNGEEFINGLMEDTITTILNQIKNLSNRLTAVENKLYYQTLYKNLGTLDDFILNGLRYYYNAIMILFPREKLGYWRSGPGEEPKGFTYTISGEIEILDFEIGLQKCYVELHFSVYEAESNTDIYDYWKTELLKFKVIGGNYEWRVLCCNHYSDDTYVNTGEQYALAIVGNNSIIRVRSKLDYLEMSNSYVYDPPGKLKLNYGSLYKTYLNGQVDIKAGMRFESYYKTTYKPSYLIGDLKVLDSFTVYNDNAEIFKIIDGGAYHKGNWLVTQPYLTNNYYNKESVNEMLDTLSNDLTIDYDLKFDDTANDYNLKLDVQREDLMQELLNHRSELEHNVKSWMIPFSDRLYNVESTFGDIELLLDKILGYETNEYLNETLDEIIG